MLTFIYLNTGDEAWDWSLPSKVKIDNAIQKSKFAYTIGDREAYIWRGANVPYEHFAMTRDIVLKRFMRRFEETAVEVEEVVPDDRNSSSSKESDERKVEEESSSSSSSDDENEDVSLLDSNRSSNSTLAKIDRFLRVRRSVKVHPKLESQDSTLL